MAQTKQGKWMSMRSAAAYLERAPVTIQRMIDRGELPAYRCGSAIRLLRSDVEAAIQPIVVEPTSK